MKLTSSSREINPTDVNSPEEAHRKRSGSLLALAVRTPAVDVCLST
jgi:hypothetical protein